MAYQFASVKEALSVARGKCQAVDVDHYYDAWQYLYDHNHPLSESDTLYLDKLICDGVILTPENIDELKGVPYRGAHAYGVMARLESDE